MKHTLEIALVIPEGLGCEIREQSIACSEGGKTLTRSVPHAGILARVEGNTLILAGTRNTKTQRKRLNALRAHVLNMFRGLQKMFVYRLEACNVHFPMTLKLDGNRVIITNFLGERTPRAAAIEPGVVVEIKGQKITVSSHDREAAGQTAANLERATRIKNRDRRVFQDGIYIVERPGREP